MPQTMTQRLLLAVAFAVVVSLAPVALGVAPPDCSEPPDVWIGIPRAAGDPLTTAAIRENLQLLYRDPCDSKQPLQIQNAYGSDYQMLEWLENGDIDGAILTDLSLWMLHQDGKFVELPAESAGALLAPLPKASLMAVRRGSTWQTRDATAAEYQQFLQQVWDTRNSEGKPSATLALATHLSTTGFLSPVSTAAAFFEPRIAQDGHDADELRTAVWKKFFASTRFTIECSTIDDCLSVVAADRPAITSGPILYFPGEEVLQRMPLPPRGDPAREHFVVAKDVADKLFPPNTAGFQFVSAVNPKLDPALAALLAHPPSILRHIIEPEPMYGTRIYSFTPDESLRLLYQQQARSQQDELALVLPGGGVKAAYQTGIIDTLYNSGQLWNGIKEPSKRNALAVRTVIGTSGGALLGFFTAQLQPGEKRNLSKILWEKDDGSALDSEDVFSFTDLPRYVSIGAAFLIFSLLLAFISGFPRAQLCGRAPTPQPSWRWRLIIIAVLFFSAPLLVRHVLGAQVEHVPVIEGIFYSLMVVIILFVDHCVVDRGPGTHAKRPALRQAIILAVIGLLLIGWALSSGNENGFLKQDVTFGAAFLLLGAFFVGAPLLMLYLGGRAGKLEDRVRETALAAVAVTLLCAFGVPGWFPVAQLLGFLLLVGVALTVYFYTRSQSADAAGEAKKTAEWIPPLLAGLTLFCTAMLCWPKDAPDHGIVSVARFADPSLGLEFGPFFASVGMIVLIFAVVILAYRDERYGADNVDNFLWGLVIILGHTGLTLGAIFALSALTRGKVHTLEMTGSFWFVLISAATVFALTLIYIATRKSTHPVVDKIRTGVRFLADEHYNGTYIPRRYARVLGVMIFAVSWWNFVIAPAIYGNEVAGTYIRNAITRFHKERQSSGFNPAARFIATANLLERDGTYFFVFHPEAEETTAASSKRDGAVWLDYPTTGRPSAAPDCRKKIDPHCKEFVRDVVFASGSPFPIFAAHSITIPGQKQQSFVDGGYSNNIPVDAAKAVEAKQVLIIHSANPLVDGHHEESPAEHLWRPGQLVMNARRLPGFLFERSQQLDRLSSHNLFVVALAPPLELSGRWPNLAQFDSTTVETMRRDAREQIGQRIGLVESWGRPQFTAGQVAIDQVTPTATSAIPAASRSARRARSR